MLTTLRKVLNSKHFPNRSEIAGGLAGIAAGVLASVLGLDAQTATILVGLVMSAVIRLVPDSVRDIAKRADVMIVQNAGIISSIVLAVTKEDAKKMEVPKTND